jgi:predicted  nucleic acid-binding Zn-ribbon protein
MDASQAIAFLQQELRLSNDREAVLAEKLGRSRAEVAELTNRLHKAQEQYRNARKSAREALQDMAEENAKLVAAFVQKRKDYKQLQVCAPLCAPRQPQHMPAPASCIRHTCPCNTSS